MASGVHIMERPVPHQHQQEALKCPRCESSNTKFCYYNNYSLSQPRHFCKACKRYWTRGGTLRNVPVGGGCRKNKRAKRLVPTSTHVAAPSAPVDHHNTNPNPNPNRNRSPNLDHLPSSTTSNNNSNHHLNPLFYGLLPQNPNYPRFDARVSGVSNTHVSGYDLFQPHLNTQGEGFSSSGQVAQLLANQAQNSNSVLSNYPSSMFAGASTSTSTSSPTMASLLASNIHQQQRFMGFAAYDERGRAVVDDLKMEETPNRMEWHNFHGQNSVEQIEAIGSSDPNSLLWDTAPGSGGGWIDPTNNIGSSVPSLI